MSSANPGSSRDCDFPCDLILAMLSRKERQICQATDSGASDIASIQPWRRQGRGEMVAMVGQALEDMISSLYIETNHRLGYMHNTYMITCSYKQVNKDNKSVVIFSCGCNGCTNSSS